MRCELVDCTGVASPRAELERYRARIERF